MHWQSSSKYPRRWCAARPPTARSAFGQLSAADHRTNSLTRRKEAIQMWKYGKYVLLPALVGASLLGTACDEAKTITQIQHDTVRVTVHDTVRIGNTTRTFDQIERLGNPLY